MTLQVLTLCDSPFRPINISQRVSPAASTATTSSAMAHRTLHHLTRCSGGQMKVPSADTLMGPDMAKRNLLKPLEEKMVRRRLCLLNLFRNCYINTAWLRIFDWFLKPTKCIIPNCSRCILQWWALPLPFAQFFFVFCFVCILFSQFLFYAYKYIRIHMGIIYQIPNYCLVNIAGAYIYF